MASLTKEELKNSLISHGITPPPASAKKEEFVALYEEHVAPVDQEAGDFSSDDEVTISPRKKASQSSVKSTSSTKSKKGKQGVEEVSNSMVVEEVDIDALQDDELFQLLKENGVDAGPIVETTRPFYKKKLASLLKGENGIANGTNGEFSDTEPEEEEDDQPSVVTTPKEPERRVSTRNKVSSASKVSTASSRASNRSVTQSPPAAVLSPESRTSGLRKRITDELDASTLRHTPTPRRSIHTYKVTETTKQTVVVGKDGLETRDITHTVEKSESKGDEAAAAKSSFFTVKRLLLVLLIVGLILAALAFFRQKDMSVDSIMDSLQESMEQAPPAAAPTAAPAATAAPPKPAAPEQPAVADI